jgi:hypothetical protein
MPSQSKKMCRETKKEKKSKNFVRLFCHLYKRQQLKRISSLIERLLSHTKTAIMAGFYYSIE